MQQVLCVVVVILGVGGGVAVVVVVSPMGIVPLLLCHSRAISAAAVPSLLLRLLLADASAALCRSREFEEKAGVQPQLLRAADSRPRAA